MLHDKRRNFGPTTSLYLAKYPKPLGVFPIRWGSDLLGPLFTPWRRQDSPTLSEHSTRGYETLPRGKDRQLADAAKRTLCFAPFREIVALSRVLGYFGQTKNGGVSSTETMAKQYDNGARLTRPVPHAQGAGCKTRTTVTSRGEANEKKKKRIECSDTSQQCHVNVYPVHAVNPRAEPPLSVFLVFDSDLNTFGCWLTFKKIYCREDGTGNNIYGYIKSDGRTHGRMTQGDLRNRRAPEQLNGYVSSTTT